MEEIKGLRDSYMAVPQFQQAQLISRFECLERQVSQQILLANLPVASESNSPTLSSGHSLSELEEGEIVEEEHSVIETLRQVF